MTSFFGRRTEEQTARVTAKNEAEDFEIEESIKIIDALEYQGFDVNAIRQKYFENKSGDNSIQTLINVISGYIRVGNNIERSTKKIADAVKGQEIARLMSGLGIFSKAVDKNTLTLPRLAIAFAPIVLFVREQAVLANRNISVNVDTTSPAIMQDLAFAGLTDLDKFSPSKDFQLKFGVVLQRAKEIKEKTKASDKMSLEDINKQTEKWMNVGVTGRANDFLMNTFEWSDEPVTKEKIIKFYKDCKLKVLTDKAAKTTGAASSSNN